MEDFLAHFPFVISHRFSTDCTNFSGHYAEVSTFNKAPSECNSPAAYATTTLVDSSRLIDPKCINNQNMYYSGELYPQVNRCVYSESYYNPNEKMNLNVVRLGCNTMNPNPSSSSFGTVRKNRLKILRNPHFRISFGDGKSNDMNGSSQNLNDSQRSQLSNEQFYVKVGETQANSVDKTKWMQQSEQQMQHQQEQNHQMKSHHNIYENRRANVEKNIIYAQEGNRNIMNCIGSNKRFDEV